MSNLRTDPPMMLVVCWARGCKRLYKWVPGCAGTVSHGMCRYHFLLANEDGGTLTVLEGVELFWRRYGGYIVGMVMALAALHLCLDWLAAHR